MRKTYERIANVHFTKFCKLKPWSDRTRLSGLLQDVVAVVDEETEVVSESLLHESQTQPGSSTTEWSPTDTPAGTLQSHPLETNQHTQHFTPW